MQNTPLAPISCTKCKKKWKEKICFHIPFQIFQCIFHTDMFPSKYNVFSENEIRVEYHREN